MRFLIFLYTTAKATIKEILPFLALHLGIASDSHTKVCYASQSTRASGILSILENKNKRNGKMRFLIFLHTTTKATIKEI